MILKKVTIYILLVLIISSCNFEKPTQFSTEALSEIITTLSGETNSLENILEDYKGKVVVIDVWAAWCRDCIEGMPKVKQLQNQFKDVEFVFLSVDRSVESWKRAIKKYEVDGNHYFVNSGQKGELNTFLNSNWIPRYMVLDKQGNIVLFKAKNAKDQRIIEALTNSI